MNKKQIYILSLLLSLMVVLIFMQQFFSEDIRKVAMRNNGIKNFTEYKLNEGRYKVLLPREWSIEDRRENIGENELEVEFNSDKIKGNIIILNDINSIEEVNTIIFQNLNNKKYYGYKSNGVSWNVVDYEVKENGYTFRNKCYFREYSEGKVILISFRYDEGKFKPSMEVVFEEIVGNFR